MSADPVPSGGWRLRRMCHCQAFTTAYMPPAQLTPAKPSLVQPAQPSPASSAQPSQPSPPKPAQPSQLSPAQPSSAQLNALVWALPKLGHRDASLLARFSPVWGHRAVAFPSFGPETLGHRQRFGACPSMSSPPASQLSPADASFLALFWPVASMDHDSDNLPHVVKVTVNASKGFTHALQGQAIKKDIVGGSCPFTFFDTQSCCTITNNR